MSVSRERAHRVPSNPSTAVSRERAHRVPWFTCLLVALLCPAAAHAQPDQEQLREQARQAFEQAQVHEQNERFALAAEGFLQAHALMEQAGRPDAPIILWNAGAALAHVPGREQDAIDLIARFLSETTHLADDGDEQRAQRVRSWRSDAVSRLEELRARLAEHEPSDEGASGDERGESEPEPEPVELDTAPSPIGPVLLGVGGAALIAGAIVGGVLIADNDSLLARCDAGNCPSEARAQAEDVQTLGLATDILLVTGALVAATGLVLTLVLHEDQVQDDVAAVSALCGYGGCSFTLHGSF